MRINSYHTPLRKREKNSVPNGGLSRFLWQKAAGHQPKVGRGLPLRQCKFLYSPLFNGGRIGQNTRFLTKRFILFVERKRL